MSSAQEEQSRKKRESEQKQGLGRLEPQLEPAELRRARDARGERSPSASAQEAQHALHARIENDFRYHTPTREKTEGFEEMRTRARHLAHSLVEIVPPGRELSTALTKLEEVIFHANAGLARHG